MLQLIKHASGSHVVHALLDKLPLHMLGFIFEEVNAHCSELAMDQHGLCVLKKCISLATDEDFYHLAEKVTIRGPCVCIVVWMVVGNRILLLLFGVFSDR